MSPGRYKPRLERPRAKKVRDLCADARVKAAAEEQGGKKPKAPTETKRRYEVAQAASILDALASSKATVEAMESSSWATAHAAIATPLKGKGAADFLVTKMLVSLMLHAPEPPTFIDDGVDLGPGSKASLYVMNQLLLSGEYRISQKIKPDDLPAAGRSSGLIFWLIRYSPLSSSWFIT